MRERTSARLWVRLRRTASVLVRTLGPVVGFGLPGLLRHPVWTTAAVEGGGLGVVIVPGFGGADVSMAVLRRWLRGRGYMAAGVRFRMNLGCTTDLVRGLVMFGSPVLDPLDVRGVASVILRVVVRLSALGVRGLLNGDCLLGSCRDAAVVGLAAPLRVPAVAVYSRDDGVVGWRSCQDPCAEWIEVGSSHTGMGIDPDFYAALVPRLAGWAADPQRASGLITDSACRGRIRCHDIAPEGVAAG